MLRWMTNMEFRTIARNLSRRRLSASKARNILCRGLFWRLGKLAASAALAWCNQIYDLTRAFVEESACYTTSAAKAATSFSHTANLGRQSRVDDLCMRPGG